MKADLARRAMESAGAAEIAGAIPSAPWKTLRVSHSSHSPGDERVRLFQLSTDSGQAHYYELNLKLFLGRGLPSSPADFKKLVKSLSGDIFRRQPEEYREVFDLDAAIAAADRRGLLDTMFTAIVDRIVSASSSPAGILRLRDEGLLYLLPMAEVQLRTG